MREEIKAGSLCVFWPQIRPSVGFGRILPDLSNPRMYTGVRSTDPAENHRENPPRVPFQPTVHIPSRVPFLPTVQMPSSIEGRIREEERRGSERDGFQT
jgi:hypothetical protein